MKKKIEDDLIEYEEMSEIRKNNIRNIDNFKLTPNSNDKHEFTSELSNNYHNSPFNLNVTRQNLMSNIQPNSDNLSVSKSNTSDVPMD